MEPKEDSKVHSIKLPKGWKDKKRIGTIMKSNLICCKCPLDNRFINVRKRERWTPCDLVNHKNLCGKKVGMVIDLTNTSRYYDGDAEFTKKGIQYVKISLEGNGMVVEEAKIKQLTAIIHSFVTANEDKLCVIHCTHGFNRTGLVVCSYYCEYLGMTIDEAFDHFKKHRPNGIYRLSIALQLEKLFDQVLCEANKQTLLDK